MKHLFIKLIILLGLLNVSLFASSEATVLFSQKKNDNYNEKVYRKTTILFTEARLKLQKKYKKYLNFVYDDVGLTNKKEIAKHLKKIGARYYAYTDVRLKKKHCKKLQCKAKYVIKIYDAKKKKSMKLSLKAIINNNEFAQITSALMKANTKKLYKFLK